MKNDEINLSFKPHDSMASGINPWAHPRRVSDCKSHQRESAGGLCIQQRKPAERKTCRTEVVLPGALKCLSNLCKFGKKHGELLFVRFECSANQGWKSLIEIFPNQKSPIALYSFVPLTFCFVLWSAIQSFLWTCVWPLSLASRWGRAARSWTHFSVCSYSL